MPPKRKSARQAPAEESAAKLPRLSFRATVEYDFETDGKFLQDAQLQYSLLSSQMNWFTDIFPQPAQFRIPLRPDSDLLRANMESPQGHLGTDVCLLQSDLWRELQGPSNYLLCRERFNLVTNFSQESDTVALEEDEPVGIDGMLRYLYARTRPKANNATLEDMVMQLVTADKYCLQTFAQSIKRVIKERIDQLQNQAEYTEETRRNLQGLVGSVFAEDGGPVWDDLRNLVAKLVLVVMMKQKETRDEMEGMMDGTPQLRKLVLNAALEAVDSSGAKEEEYILE